tara:strand:- start:169 stop:483 length:315 start_codon:yes stop_codon:yes gene_type:complete
MGCSINGTYRSGADSSRGTGPRKRRRREHTFLPTAQERPFFCIWEAKEAVALSDFRNDVDAPDDINQSLHLNNAIQRIDLGLTGGTKPCSANLITLNTNLAEKG